MKSRRQQEHLGRERVRYAASCWRRLAMKQGLCRSMRAAAALDAPVRQTFVAEMVGDADLPNAVALNSTSFNGAQLIGPAVAGLLVTEVGIGWAFLLNGLSFAAVLVSMSFFRLPELRTSVRAHRTTSGFLEGLRYVWRKPELRAILIMLFLIGTFGLNFPIFISTMAVNVFHSDARAFALLSSIMAVGTLSGALVAASRKKPSLASLLWRELASSGSAALWPQWRLDTGGLEPLSRSSARLA